MKTIKEYLNSKKEFTHHAGILFEGGPGSGVKGHTTAGDPSEPKTKKIGTGEVSPELADQLSKHIVGDEETTPTFHKRKDGTVAIGFDDNDLDTIANLMDENGLDPNDDDNFDMVMNHLRGEYENKGKAKSEDPKKRSRL